LLWLFVHGGADWGSPGGNTAWEKTSMGNLRKLIGPIFWGDVVGQGEKLNDADIGSGFPARDLEREHISVVGHRDGCGTGLGHRVVGGRFFWAGSYKK